MTIGWAGWVGNTSLFPSSPYMGMGSWAVIVRERSDDALTAGVNGMEL